MTNGKQTQANMNPLIIPNLFQVQNHKKFGQDFVPIFNIFWEILQVKNGNYCDRTLLWKMIYNDKIWQSINKTNQESKYLQFCRAKAYYVVQHTFLTEAVLTLLLYKNPAGYCTSIASQVRVSEWIWVQNSKYLYKISLFISLWWVPHQEYLFYYGELLTILLTQSLFLWWETHQFRHTFLVRFSPNLFRNLKSPDVTHEWFSWHMQWLYDITKAYFLFRCLNIQKFFKELSFFFCQNYFPAIFLRLSHSDLWYFPLVLSSLFFNCSWGSCSVDLTASFDIDDICSEGTFLYVWYIHSILAAACTHSVHWNRIVALGCL